MPQRGKACGCEGVRRALRGVAEHLQTFPQQDDLAEDVLLHLVHAVVGTGQGVGRGDFKVELCAKPDQNIH